MAIKFPKVHVKSGEIIHPDDLLKNAAEFVNELNGSIDSDNLKNTPYVESFSSKCFHEVYRFRRPDLVDVLPLTTFTCPSSTSSYVKKDLENNQLAGVEFDSDTDGWAIIDFNSTFKWTGTGITSAAMAADMQVAALMSETGGSYLESGIGMSRTNMPAGGWMGVSGEDTTRYNPCERGGEYSSNLRDQLGLHVDGLSVQNFPLGQWSDVPVDFYCLQFRITINGNLVSESGHLFNGNWRNAIYLCGATPVVAGKNRIDVEVRAFTAIELKTSRVGIGARDEHNLRGKFQPFQMVSSDVHPSPLPEFESQAISLEDINALAGSRFDTKGNHDDLDKGIKCEILDRHLLVQLRKR